MRTRPYSVLLLFLAAAGAGADPAGVDERIRKVGRAGKLAVTDDTRPASLD